MPNGDAINDRLEFKEKMKALPEEERSVEVAMMVYDMKVEMDNYSNGSFSKKGSVISSSTISIIIIGIWEGLKQIFNRGN